MCGVGMTGACDYWMKLCVHNLAHYEVCSVPVTIKFACRKMNVQNTYISIR